MEASKERCLRQRRVDVFPRWRLVMWNEKKKIVGREEGGKEKGEEEKDGMVTEKGVQGRVTRHEGEGGLEEGREREGREGKERMEEGI